MKTILLTLALIAPAAAAQQVASLADLKVLLDDRIQEENFEGLSVHGGTSFEVPNPFNSETTPPSWGVQPGVSYSSPGTLSIFGGFSGGDDNNFLRATDEMLIEFEVPQAAVGFNNTTTAGNTVTFFRDLDEVGSIFFPSPPTGSLFAGWLDSSGITSIRITHTNPSFLSVIDDVTWGFDVAPCPADVAPPVGVLDLADINTYIQDFVEGEDSADIAPPSAVLDLADLNLFISSFLSGCP